ncbi:MAG: tetratricopeptide repeat protein [Pseudomonadota bacterium]
MCLAPALALAKPVTDLGVSRDCAVRSANSALLGARTCEKSEEQCKAERFNESLQNLTCQAESGDGEAAYMLGKMYFNGIHVAVDQNLAIHFWRKSAKSGHPAAQHDFAILLLTDGFPTIERTDEALYWLGTSASSGHALSAIVLGRLYEIGWYNIAPDLCMALTWYEAGEMMGLTAPNDYLDDTRQSSLANCI